MNSIKKNTCSNNCRAGKNKGKESLKLGLYRFGIPKSVLVDNGVAFCKVKE